MDGINSLIEGDSGISTVVANAPGTIQVISDNKTTAVENVEKRKLQSEINQSELSEPPSKITKSSTVCNVDMLGAFEKHPPLRSPFSPGLPNVFFDQTKKVPGSEMAEGVLHGVDLLTSPLLVNLRETVLKEVQSVLPGISLEEKAKVASLLSQFIPQLTKDVFEMVQSSMQDDFAKIQAQLLSSTSDNGSFPIHEFPIVSETLKRHGGASAKNLAVLNSKHVNGSYDQSYRMAAPNEDVHNTNNLPETKLIQVHPSVLEQQLSISMDVKDESVQYHTNPSNASASNEHQYSDWTEDSSTEKSAITKTDEQQPFIKNQKMGITNSSKRAQVLSSPIRSTTALNMPNNNISKNEKPSDLIEQSYAVGQKAILSQRELVVEKRTCIEDEKIATTGEIWNKNDLSSVSHSEDQMREIRTRKPQDHRYPTTQMYYNQEVEPQNADDIVENASGTMLAPNTEDDRESDLLNVKPMEEDIELNGRMNQSHLGLFQGSGDPMDELPENQTASSTEEIQTQHSFTSHDDSILEQAQSPGRIETDDDTRTPQTSCSKLNTRSARQSTNSESSEIWQFGQNEMYSTRKRVEHFQCPVSTPSCRAPPFKFGSNCTELTLIGGYDENVTNDINMRNTVSMIVVGKGPRIDPPNPRISFMDKFVCSLTRHSVEAKRGEKYGNFVRKSGSYPGIPKRKLVENENEKSKKENYEVQTAYEIKGDPDNCIVVWEGWVPTEIRYPKSKMSEWVIKKMNMFSDFLKAMITDENRDSIEKYLYPEELIKYTQDLRWHYDDLGHFHSRIQEEYGLGPIFYVNPTKLLERPPIFVHTPVNLVNISTFNYCKSLEENKPYDVLVAGKNVVSRRESACNGPSCVCDSLFELLFGERISEGRPIINLKHNNNGIDLSDFEPSSARVAIECSDRCGCSWDCPQRQVQRGQQIPLVVTCEGENFFGVRVADDIQAGQFVTEYAGEMFRPEDVKGTVRKDKKTSYEAGFGVLDDRIIVCSQYAGSTARFISHSCEPNCTFIEVYSRRFEEDCWIPRIAVYALKAIPRAKQLTINYWAKWKPKPNGTPCLCGSKKCMQFLP